MTRAYYNEVDPFAAEWLRNLVDAGLIAPGDVDERPVEEVRPSDLDGYDQVHLFAGIGTWSYALRLAGWSDDRPVWTGSCPCQPFSAAGRRKGTDDARHLWPHFFRLLSARRPPVVLGEQVASKDGLAWLDLVSADLEGAGYAVGAADMCAAGVGAPHVRQRLWFVGLADESIERLDWREGTSGQAGRDRSKDGVALGGLGDPGRARAGRDAGADGRAQASSSGGGEPARTERDGAEPASGPSSGPVVRPWDAPDWVLCRDPGGPRWRPVEPGTFPLAHGAPARVGRLRAYGNAVVAPLAAEWARVVLEELTA